MARRHRTLARTRVIAALVMSVVVVVGTALTYGSLVLMRTPDDPVTKADAVVVLGGDHDGREAFGVDLAKRLSAGTVVLSDPHPRPDPLMDELCDSLQDGVQVMCEVVTPATTRGEAIFTQRLAAEHGWRHIVVVSWRYHLIRARYIFDQCATGGGASFAFVAVPREYQQSVAQFGYIFLYQVFAGLKAIVQGECG